MGALAAVMLGGAAGAASAQTAYGDGSVGVRPHGPGASRAHTVRPSANYRALTVRRRAPAEPLVAVLPPPPPPPGPGIVVTGPLRIASTVVDLPFRALAGIFPPEGNVAANPLVLIGAPIRAAGQIAQVPFRIIGAPFAPSEPYRFSGPAVF